MMCVRFERRIALYAGGELDEADARRVEAHLAGCANCRGLAQALRDARTDMADWNTAVPSEDDLRAVRANVLSSIAAGAPGTVSEGWRAALAGMWWWRAAALGGLATLMAGAVWFAVSRSSGPDHLAVRRHEMSGLTRVVGTPVPRVADAGVTRPDARAVPVGSEARPSVTAAGRPARRARPRPADPPAASRLQSDSPRAPVLGRLEFRTADPNIRIVWLLQEPTTPPPPRDRRLSDDDRVHPDEKGSVS